MFFLKFPCFLYDPENVGNLISGSSAFSKSSLYIWKFSVHVLLKLGLMDVECYLASTCCVLSCAAVFDSLHVRWMQLCSSLSILWGCLFLGIGMKTDLFQSCGHCWVFQICWHTECSTLTASCFRVWNSSAGIPSPPLALFVVMLPKAYFTSHSRMSGSGWVTTSLWLSRSSRPFSVNFFSVCLPPVNTLFWFH